MSHTHQTLAHRRASPSSAARRRHQALRLDHVSPQVAALPVRRGIGGLEVLLVTSRETRRWIVPKGWPMKGRKDHAAAAQEAMEEAGIRGRVRKHPIGAYTYLKRLADRDETCRVMVYRLDVEAEETTWKEAGQREREWFAPRDAAARVSEPALATMILALESDPEWDAALTDPER